MISEVPVSQIRKFRVHLLSNPNSEVLGLADSEFNPLRLSEKFVGAPIHPPLGDIKVLVDGR